MRNLFIFIFCLFASCANAQLTLSQGGSIEDIDYKVPKDYILGGITVEGTRNLDQDALIRLSGLTIGDRIKIPGDDIGNAIQKLWKEKLFENIEISATKINGGTIFLNFLVKEQPRLSRFKFKGVSKSEADNLRDDINLYKEKIITEGLVKNTSNTVTSYFVDKGFLNTVVKITQIPDSVFLNHVILEISVEKNKKVKINEIVVKGNSAFSVFKIKRSLKETKEKSVFTPFIAFDSLLFETTKDILRLRVTDAAIGIGTYAQEYIKVNIFKSSKYLEFNLKEDKKVLIGKYNQDGYRDAKILRDSIYQVGNDINLELTIDEGPKYYFRNITWIGNAQHETKDLNNILGINKGDIYNQSLLETRLFMNPNGADISSLYMDKGYLFFNITPVEVLVENDSIDIELRVYEGAQARINKVTVVGNTKTNDHVVMREIRTRPGQLFSRSDIIRSQRELSQLGFFDAEKLNVVPTPNPVEGTVDIEYQVEEKSSDQIEVSGGWGGNRVVGTLGVSFSNFSTKNFFKKGAWRPLPAGDGQRLSIRAQSNGAYYQSYNISFTEPWLGRRKPNALSLTAYHSVQTNGEFKLKDVALSDIAEPNGHFEFDEMASLINQDINPLDLQEEYESLITPSFDDTEPPMALKVSNAEARQSIKISGLSVGLGKRLTFPDDYFTMYAEASYQNYIMNNWFQFAFPNGTSNNAYLRLNISRNSIDQPIYPRLGSSFSLSLQATPPYTNMGLIKHDAPFDELTSQDKYKWIEYHKWKFTSSWFSTIVGNLVLNARMGYGFLGNYNKQLGAAPFERFYLGGSGLTGFSLDGREIIALRGYDDNSLAPTVGSTIINKYTLELRYPFSLNPNATIYGLGFLEAGNTWNSFKEFNPFSVKRSGGVGIRIFLPMFGLLGLDWGYRFDDSPHRSNMQRSQIHFTIGANLGEL